jgi:flagellar biosynthesis/type III secretory pathway protein FliH
VCLTATAQSHQLHRRTDRYELPFTEINDGAQKVSEDLKREKVVRDAVECLEPHGYSKEQMITYEKYWDAVSTAITYENEKTEEALKAGFEKGQKAGLEKGREEGAFKRNHEIAREMLADKWPVEKIARYTELSATVIEQLRNTKEA